MLVIPGFKIHSYYGCIFFFLFTFFFLVFRATFLAYGGSRARGRIGATAAGLDHSHNAGSLTRWARPGIETSWLLVRFASFAPQREFHLCSYFLKTTINFTNVWNLLFPHISPTAPPRFFFPLIQILYPCFQCRSCFGKTSKAFYAREYLIWSPNLYDRLFGYKILDSGVPAVMQWVKDTALFQQGLR